MTHAGSSGDLTLHHHHHHHPRFAVSRKFSIAVSHVNREVTKLKAAAPSRGTPPRPAASPTSGSWGWCHRAAQMANFPPWVGCLQPKPLLCISSWMHGHILSAATVTTAALSASISFPSPRSQPFIMAPVDVTSTKWRRPRCTFYFIFVI